MEVRFGLRANWKQFTILAIINGFVGGMVGLERSILPEIAEADFGIAAKTAILSFIMVFGISKAITNYYTGRLADHLGRKRLLVTGWLAGLPVPLILMFAGHWNWILAANALLGINQGLTWSSTVVMKIDLVGDKNRGLAMGINESIGYLAVGLVAFFTGWMASHYGLRPFPFYLGIGLVMAGLLSSLFLVKDTVHHVRVEGQSSSLPLQHNVFWATSWRDPNLGSITQAGLFNNLNDGMIWGLLPLLLGIRGFGLTEIGKIVAIYPIVWGLGQIFTGRLADMVVKKTLLVLGMLLQGLALTGMIWAASFASFTGLCILLGVGTALVYPTFLAAIAEHTHPQQRAQSIGVFRLWRDLGYAIGALITGLIADWFGLNESLAVVAGLTIFSALIILARMR